MKKFEVIMMKTLIISTNAKYIHSSLAPWYLKAYCGDRYGKIKVMDFTINDSMDSVVASIYSEKADVVCFACYIWNIEYVSRLAECLKKVAPASRIVFGGPEVSYDPENIMEKNKYLDYIISGEGEDAFKELLEHLHDGAMKLKDIDGLTYRESGRIVANRTCRTIKELDSIPSPYTDEMLNYAGNRIIYFETSRGCPFSCSYCLSSTAKGVRYFSMDRVKQDLLKLIGAGIKLVKFVDRTFNCNRARAKEIIRFIIDNASETSFHFEAAADLFDEEILDLIGSAPEGLIQLEIGVQSTNKETLELINRRTDLEKIFQNAKKIMYPGNVHMHLDLIAGLPGEDYDSFKKSFDDVYSLWPHQLQLGFLKMLKGTKIREEAHLHGYCFKDFPPYEVLYNKYISYEEMIELKGIEDLVERYHNSGRFACTLKYVINDMYRSPFEFFREFHTYCMRMNFSGKAFSSRDTYTILLGFIAGIAPEEKYKIIKDIARLDFLSSDNSNNLPAGLERNIEPGFKEKCFEFLRVSENIEIYLPAFTNLPPKQIIKKVHFEIFNYDVTLPGQKTGIKKGKTVVLFDYSRKDRVTGLYSHMKISNW